MLLWLLATEATAQAGEEAAPAWQTGRWSSTIISSCSVAATPEPTQAAAITRCFDKRSPQQPVASPLPSPLAECKRGGLWRDESWGGLKWCLGWGNVRGGGEGQKKDRDPLLTEEVAADIALLVRNSTRLCGTRSHCRLVRGPFFDLRALHPGLLGSYQPPPSSRSSSSSSSRRRL